MIDHPQHRTALEEDHIALRIKIVAERLARDHEQRIAFEIPDQIVAQHRSIVARQHGEEHRGRGEAAVAIADRVIEAVRPVEAGLGTEFDHPVGAQHHLAQIGEARDADQRQGVAVFVGIIGQQGRRVDHQHLIFVQFQAVIVARLGRIVERAHFQLVGQRRCFAAGIDHVIGDRAQTERIGGEGYRLRRSIINRRAGCPSFAVGTGMQSDEIDPVTFDVIGIGEQIGDRQRDRLGQADRMDRVAITRGIVDRGDIDLHRRGGGQAIGVGQHVLEARRAEVIAADREFEIVAIDLAGNIGAGQPIIVVPIGFDIGSVGCLQRLQRNDMQPFCRRGAIDIIVIGQQGIDTDPQDRIFAAQHQGIIDRSRRVVDRGQINLDPGRTFAAELIAHGVIEEPVPVVVGRTGEHDLALIVNRYCAVLGAADANQSQRQRAVCRIVDNQIGQIDDHRNVFELEAHDVIGCVEAAQPLQLFDPRAIPHGAIGKDHFLDPGLAAKEVITHPHRIDKKPVKAFEFDHQVVAHLDDRYVLRRNRGQQLQPISIGGIAQFDNQVFAIIESEQIGVRTEAARNLVIPALALEGIRAGTADEHIAKHRADQLFDSRKLIALSLAAKPLPGCQIDRDGFVRA